MQLLVYARRHRAAVMAALLHDVLDDTAVGYAALEEAFGPQVAGMVAQVGATTQGCGCVAAWLLRPFGL